MTAAAPARPLDGVRIVDLSTVLSGPIASGLLADQGADVIKVESPDGDTCRQIGPAKGDLTAAQILDKEKKEAAQKAMRLLRARMGRPKGVDKDW